MGTVYSVVAVAGLVLLSLIWACPMRRLYLSSLSHLRWGLERR